MKHPGYRVKGIPAMPVCVPLPQSCSEVVVWDAEEAQMAKRLCAAPIEFSYLSLFVVVKFGLGFDITALCR